MKKKEPKIVESFLKNIPVFGDFFKELGKTEVFKEKFKEANKKIEENLRKKPQKMWKVDTNISVRPIFNKIKKETTDIFIGKNYFYGKKGHKLTLAVKVPKSPDANHKIKGKTLLITSGDFKKEIKLPDYFKNIKKKRSKKGVLVLELTK